MVVNKKVGIRNIAKDVADGMMILQGISELLLLVGHADVLNGEDMVWVLERLILSLEKIGYKGKVMLA